MRATTTPLMAWARTRLAAAGRQGIDGEVVLQTFPRLLGYVFNPISVWYCYDLAGALRAAICEVNNTFGEHHHYVLGSADNAPITANTCISADKQLHVSPFCEVRGHYRFRFVQDGTDRARHATCLARLPAVHVWRRGAHPLASFQAVAQTRAVVSQAGATHI